MTDTHPTRIVGLECTECGQETTLKVAEADAELQNEIGYVCESKGSASDKGCDEFRTQTINHIYGEPAASRIRELNYNG
jgi:hypothetical protein